MMNVFDEEMGPLAELSEIELLQLLYAASLTLQEMRAYGEYLRKGQQSKVN